MSQLTEQSKLFTDDEARALYRAGKNIDAIRALRARDGSSLNEARDYLHAIATDDDKAARAEMNRIAQCPCAQEMQCLCAHHASGAVPTDPCSAIERSEPKLKLDWGLSGDVPAGVKLAWGGRAIYSLTTTETPQKRRGGKVVQRAKSETIAAIDIPHDRQGVSDIRDAGAAAEIQGIAAKIKIAELQAERAAFGNWINKVAIPALKKWCVKHYVTGDSEEKFELLDGSSYALVASPRASYGYLYIAAWVVPAGGLGNVSEDK